MQKLNNKRVFCTPYDDQRIVTAKIKNEKHYVLKACPFCGRKPVIETVEPMFHDAKVQYFVSCAHHGCDCYTRTYRSPGEAIAKWNRRISPLDRIVASDLKRSLKAAQKEATNE